MHFNRFIGPALRVLLGIVVLGGHMPVRAAVVDGLYTATVELRSGVADQLAAARADAMATVLVRVTGSRMAAQAPELARLLNNPERYVASFGTTSATEAVVSFLPRDIERELTAAGWPVWGAERPLSIMWIAVTDQFGEQAILSAGGPPPDADYGENMLQLLAAVREEITTVAQARGIPWVLPRFTSREDIALTFAQVWEYAFADLAPVSDAYEADAIVIGRVRQSVIGTDVEWLLQSDSQYLSYPGAGIGDGIEWLADAFASEYSSAGGRRPITLRITGVGDFDTYSRVVSYLESVTMLGNVDVESFSGGELLLRAESRGNADVLSRTLGLDDVLRERPRAFGAPQPAGGNVLELLVVPERRSFGGSSPPR